MRLIDANELIAEISNPKYPYTYDAERVFKRMIDNAPIVDAVSVVRCKDCRFGAYTQTQGDYMITCQNAESPVCGTDKLVKPDWFCACGEPERRCES